MNIIPAIDLYDGQCVRLYQGDFSKTTVYLRDPVRVAQEFEEQGAKYLHIVDLNGAQTGRPANTELIQQIKNKTNLIIQTGGGLRDQNTIEYLLKQGVDRAVLGSLGVKKPYLIKELIEKYGIERIVLALDVKISNEPIIAINGWQDNSEISLWDLLEKYEQYSGLRILCTDIDRDGVLKGPNHVLYQSCVARYPQFFFQASGGVSSIADLRKLQTCNVSGVIIGKAIYEKRFTLSEATRELVPC